MSDRPEYPFDWRGESLYTPPPPPPIQRQDKPTQMMIFYVAALRSLSSPSSVGKLMELGCEEEWGEKDVNSLV